MQGVNSITALMLKVSKKTKIQNKGQECKTGTMGNRVGEHTALREDPTKDSGRLTCRQQVMRKQVGEQPETVVY